MTVLLMTGGCRAEDQSPASAENAQSGYSVPYAPDYTVTEPRTVTCRVQYRETGRVEEQRMELSASELIKACKSGAVAFIMLDEDMIEKVPGGPPVVPSSDQEDGN